MPLFSIVIPTFNRCALLASSLASVAGQTFHDYEVIVVDDGSTDDTQVLLQSLATRVGTITQVNQGAGAARNAGAALAKGRYIVFLDSDDVWFPWTLDVLAQVVSAQSMPAIVSLGCRQFEQETELSNVNREPVRFEKFADFLSSSSHGIYVGSGTVAIKRDVFEESGGFTDRRVNAEDHDLILRLGTARGFVNIRAPEMVGWRRHAGSLTGLQVMTRAGVTYLIEQERAGVYPGGPSRARERWRIISLHARPAILEAVISGAIDEGWRLYRATARWHFSLGRVKFLLGFPLICLKARLMALAEASH